MIIKTMLDELFEQIQEVSQFEEIEMYKVTGEEYISMYYKCSGNRNNSLLDKLNKRIDCYKTFLNSIKIKQPILKENYNIDDLKNISSYIIPITFRNETVFLIHMISFNENICITEERRKDIDEIVSSFEEFFCLGDMIKIDMIRDRISLAV